VGMRWFLWRHWVGTQKIFPYLWIDWIGKASLLRDIKNATFFIMLIYFDLSIGATPHFYGVIRTTFCWRIIPLWGPLVNRLPVCQVGWSFK
jgi:hypothetical protein